MHAVGYKGWGDVCRHSRMSCRYVYCTVPHDLFISAMGGILVPRESVRKWLEVCVCLRTRARVCYRTADGGRRDQQSMSFRDRKWMECECGTGSHLCAHKRSSSRKEAPRAFFLSVPSCQFYQPLSNKRGSDNWMDDLFLLSDRT